MGKQKKERIAIIIDSYTKQRIKEKCCANRKTITQVITHLLEKWLKGKDVK